MPRPAERSDGVLCYNEVIKTILYIDGRNILGKMAAVFSSVNQPIPAWDSYNFKGLLEKVLEGIIINEMVFYFAKIKDIQTQKIGRYQGNYL